MRVVDGCLYGNDRSLAEAVFRQPFDVVGIGETGLDYFRTEGNLDWQRERFRTHIRAARLAAKPLIVNDHGWYAEIPDTAALKVPPDDPAALLAAIREFSDLGAGFRIAALDLDAALSRLDPDDRVAFRGAMRKLLEGYEKKAMRTIEPWEQTRYGEDLVTAGVGLYYFEESAANA